MSAVSYSIYGYIFSVQVSFIKAAFCFSLSSLSSEKQAALSLIEIENLSVAREYA